VIRLVFLGPPGAGKGSLASLCKTRLGLTHLSTGAIFRQEIELGTTLGKRVQRYVTNGRLVPPNLVVEVMASRLPRRGKKGFVLDGFPRTRSQARGLDRILKKRKQALTAAVYITSPQALLVRRLSGRRVCQRCAENYHMRTMRPRHTGQCDRCNGKLITRKDDQPKTIRQRLRIDRKEAAPLLAYYQKQGLLHRVNGEGHITSVFTRTLALFEKEGWMSRQSIRKARR
jgi:adenylate kinase